MKARAIPAAVVVVGSALIGGWVGTRAAAPQDFDRLQQRYIMYQEALSHISREYVEPVDDAQMVYGSVEGLLRTLDPHSSFLDPTQYTRMREQQSGHYPGIGISIVSLDGSITVTQLFEDSPAYRAGIRRNDVIARVGQPVDEGGKRRIAWEETKGWATEEIVKRVRGPGHDRGDFDPAARGGQADRSHGGPRRDQDHDRAHRVHDRPRHGLHPDAGFFGDHRR
jgi:carboxyl-terminal processing protease